MKKIAKEKFINSINDQAMTAGLLKGLITTKHTSKVTSEHILSWVKIIEAQQL